MKSLKELRDDIAVLNEEMEDLINRAKQEKRELTIEENKQFDKISFEQDELEEKIKRAQRVEKLNAEKAKPIEEPKEEKAPEYKDVWLKYNQYGGKTLSTKEQNILAQYRGTDPQATTTGAAGGYLIPEGFSNELFVEMALWGGMLEASRIVRTATGNTIPWPTVDDTSNTGALLAENTQGVVGDVTFDTKNLGAYMFYTKFVKVPVQLLQDSYFDLEEFLREAFARRLGTIMNYYATVGTGSSQPQGVIPAATVATTSASNTTVTRPELITLIHSVDPAYRRNGRLMMNDTSLSVIKKISFGSSDARPLWQASMQDGTPANIDGFQYVINQDMANFGAGNKPIAFGDFSKFIIRMAGDTTSVRLDERFADYLQVAFLAYQRMDSEILSTNAIKVLRNPTT